MLARKLYLHPTLQKKNLVQINIKCFKSDIWYMAAEMEGRDSQASVGTEFITPVSLTMLLWLAWKVVPRPLGYQSQQLDQTTMTAG